MGVGKKGGVPYRLEELGTDDGLLNDPQGIHNAVTNLFTRWFSRESEAEGTIGATGTHWTQLQQEEASGNGTLTFASLTT